PPRLLPPYPTRRSSDLAPDSFAQQPAPSAAAHADRDDSSPIASPPPAAPPAAPPRPQTPPSLPCAAAVSYPPAGSAAPSSTRSRSEEHTSELQSPDHLV